MCRIGKSIDSSFYTFLYIRQDTNWYSDKLIRLLKNQVRKTGKSDIYNYLFLPF